MTQAFNLAQLANNLNTSGQLDATDGLSGLIANANLASSGTADSTTFLRGDRTWGTITQRILQVVQAVSNTQQSTSSRSMIDVTGMSASITPASSSNKILVLVDLKAGCGYQGYFGANLLRNSTVIYNGGGTYPYLSFRYTTSGDAEGRYSVFQMGGNFLDSPGTTSSVTYKLQYQASGQGTAYVNRSEYQDVNAGSTASSITLIEVAA